MKSSGGSFTIEDILPAEKSGNQKNKRSGRGRSGRKEKAAGGGFETQVRRLLNDFIRMGLVRKGKGREWVIRQPFTLTGHASLNRWGAAFVDIGNREEIFIPPEKVKGALPNDLVELEVTDISRERYEGRIRKILRPHREKFLMEIKEVSRGMVHGRVLDLPLELQGRYSLKKYPDFEPGKAKKKKIFSGRALGPQIGDWLQVEPLSRWYSERDHAWMEVHPLRVHPRDWNQRDFERIVLKHNLPLEYPRTARRQADKIPKKVEASTVSDWHSREDLRELYAVTIDGATAKDFDDAISIEKKPDGYTLYVHIADVAHYVKKGGALDEEALARSTSCYLGDSVVPMLPEVLSNNLCSLRSGRNRLALTCEMRFSKKDLPDIRSFRFYNSVIKVDKRYTYVEAHQNTKDPHLKLMKELGLLLKQERNKREKLELNLPDVAPKIDPKTGRILDFVEKVPLDTHNIIEEFMVSANICAARFLKKKKGWALHREHEPMEEDKLGSLNQFLRMHGFSHQLGDISAQSLRAVLEEVQDSQVESIFNYLLLRSFKQAYYSPEGLGHWGLGLEDYAHFTSPIRRYPDLVVHRTIKAILDGERPPYNEQEAGEIGEITSRRERLAMDAERDITRLRACRFLSSYKTGTEFSATLITISPRWLIAQLDDFPIDGFILPVDAGQGKEFMMPTDFTVALKPGRKTLNLGQKIPVALKDINEEEMKIYFTFAGKP